MQIHFQYDVKNQVFFLLIDSLYKFIEIYFKTHYLIFLA